MKAKHLPGGNYFDNILIDLPESFRIQDQFIKERQKSKNVTSKYRNWIKRQVYELLDRVNLWEPLVTNGIIKSWFVEFQDYWRNCLDGRPITIQDFHSLFFNYRIKSQVTDEMNWDSPLQHLENWQIPMNLYSTFCFVQRDSLRPIRSRRIIKHFQPNMKALEYGCSNAPMFRSWKKFYSDIDMEWTLADIESFPFHYVRHVFAGDAAVKFHSIKPENFDNPLLGCEDYFDLIILQEVFEHLDNPLAVIQKLTDQLKSGGKLYFDYIKSDAIGWDTVEGLKQRKQALQFIDDHFQIVEGNFHIDDRSLGACVARKK